MLVEKPIAATSSQGEELAQAAEALGLILAVGHIERFNPAVRRLYELIQEGALGRITSCIARRVGVMPPRVRDADIVIDLAVHDIDVFDYLLGSYPERVRATGGRAWLSDRTGSRRDLARLRQRRLFHPRELADASQDPHACGHR